MVFLNFGKAKFLVGNITRNLPVKLRFFFEKSFRETL